MKNKVFLSLFVLIVFACNAAWADDVTISFVAEVTFVYDESGMLDARINIGDTMTGYYTYDPLTADSSGDSEIGNYRHFGSSQSLFFDINGITFATNPNDHMLLIQIINSTTDHYAVLGYNNITNLPNRSVDFIALGLTDSTATALSSDALPAVPPNLADWDSPSTFSIYGCGLYDILGNIISVDYGTPLPKVCGYHLVGDLNDDCEVNLADIALMFSNWPIDCDVTPGDPECIAK